MSGSFKVLRLIDHFRHAPASAAFNMALDEALLDSACKGESPPTLRLYGWSEPAVSIGRHQRASDVDLAFCRERSIPVVRRPTGGRAILHGLELTYSFSAHLPLPGFGRSVLDSYGTLSRAFMHAFRSLGLAALNGSRRKKGPGPDGANPLCFASASYGEISIGGKKIIGSAQRRCPYGFLQQGSIPLALDRETMSSVFFYK
ncbi:MAG TPA: lipoate--protein ligase family protein, partial [Nitrospirae bacterium]|nr:lipoate--protein ligase family protein [Nitrospirota bacterium]